MPALPPVPNVIQCRFVYTIGADIAAMNRIYLVYTGGPPASADLNSIAGGINTAWGTNIKALMPSAYSLTSINLLDLASSTGAQGTNATVVAGTRAGGTMTANCTALVNWVMARRYRGGKPRTYWPFGVAGDTTTPQKWGTTFITAVNTGVNNFISGVIGLTAGTTTISAHGNVSYYHGFTNVPYGSPTRYRQTPTLRSSPVVDTITTGACSAVIGSQRRRLRP